MKSIRKICGVMILVLFCTVLGAAPVTAKEAKEKIRVGYPLQEGLTWVDESGMRSGYSYDYLIEIAKYTNWEYEFVEIDGTQDEQLVTLLDMLENGEIDLMCGMVYNEALSKIYDYPGTGYGTSYYALCTLESDTEITSSNYYLKPVLRVGVYNSQNQKNEKLEQFAQMNGITMEQVICGSEEEQLALLNSGQVDMILAKDISLPATNLNTIARFSPQSYYFATTKGNRQLINELDKSLAAITQNNPYFATNLWNKYFSKQSDTLYFSSEEKDYLENAKTLKAVLMGGRPPIQYIDGATGEYRGISMDVLNYISEETGLTIDTVMTESFEEYEQLVKSGEMDIAVGVLDSLQQYDWQNSITTMPYMTAPVSIVLTDRLKPEEKEGKHLAISRGVSYAGKYSGVTSYFETPEDCLDAVHTGKADYCYANTWSVQYYISNPTCRNLIAVPLEEWEMRFCIGILDADDEILTGILNKAIQHFSDSNVISDLLYENAYRQEKVSLRSYLVSNPMEAVMLCIMFLLSVLLTGLLLLRRRDKKNQQLRRLENERYEQISEISNEFLFEYDVKADMLRMSEKCSDYLAMPRRMEKVSRVEDATGAFIQQILEWEEASGETQIRVADGSMHWMRMTTKRIKDSGGNVIYLVGKLLDIQEEREEKEKLQVKAEKDSLTGVYNMATFREKVLELYEKLDMAYYAFYIIDIDYFKQVNDTYGHYIGDYVLERIGNILLEVFSGKDDLAGRLGGDEFVAQTVYNESMDEIREKCRLLNRMVSEIGFEGKMTPITVSIGVTLVKTGSDFEDVYRQADEALYQVKREGRNSFYIHEEQEKAD